MPGWIEGHLEEYRALGGVAFALVRDGTGTTQVILKKGTADPSWFELLAALPRESVVRIEGIARSSPKAAKGVEFHPTGIRVVTRAETPLPLGIVDRVHVELDTRLNHRVLDLRKPSVRQIFELRSALLRGWREAFHRRGFIEVETPKLLRQGAEGGATLFPVDYFGQRAYLAQSPQLYKQMLMGAGFERVFEIGPAFRAEPSDTVRHITEFTSLDAEVASIETAEELREILEGILREAIESTRSALAEIANPWAETLTPPTVPLPRIPFAEAEAEFGRAGAERDLTTEEEKRLAESVRERTGSAWFFLTDFPTAIKQGTFYARRQDDDPRRTGYFDLYFEHLEVASGGPREHRLERLLANLATAGLDPAGFAGYLEPFRFGMPPHGGWGLGIDRLVQALTALPNIRETRLFPRDRWRLDP
ncbi:MAG: aspartate--tRNA(Asn) ligase [Thermoplasmata archaeon]